MKKFIPLFLTSRFCGIWIHDDSEIKSHLPVCPKVQPCIIIILSTELSLQKILPSQYTNISLFLSSKFCGNCSLVLDFFYTEHPNSLLALSVFAISFSIAYLIATSIPLLIIHTMFNSCMEHNIFSSTKTLLNSSENTSLIFPHMHIFLEFIKIPCLFD